MSRKMLCTSCGVIGTPKQRTRGSWIIAILLLFCGFIPGLIYMVWMSKGPMVCASCGGESLIPTNAPLARKFTTEVENSARVERKKVDAKAEVNQPAFESLPAWQEFQSLLRQHASSGKYGWCRNIELDKAELLKKTGYKLEALKQYLLVSHFDLNGPTNNGAFDIRNDAFLAPEVIRITKSLIDETGLDTENIRHLYTNSGEVISALKPPLSTIDTWGIFYKEIYRNKNES